ncbi:hypothetical protein DDZ13_10085 [Coraliomargarita sinensis]|uniref:Uncharacterized protein n=1 Tax=Coraliomargarita sinensis TaxID=2174842 RepID=A0A317ZI61_9BACT|nr:hypothetical protein [Coraliomargarita sinensis]PXA03977.1 hypothetical protein DDZ13_10085 [Coraliomargarita sinensis]
MKKSRQPAVVAVSLLLFGLLVYLVLSQRTDSPQPLGDLPGKEVEKEAVEIGPMHSIYFVNECSDVIVVKIEEEKKVFKPQERAYLRLPIKLDKGKISVYRKSESETKIVYESIIFLSEKRSIIMTASEKPDGSFKLFTEINPKT